MNIFQTLYNALFLKLLQLCFYRGVFLLKKFQKYFVS
nr:MAG TPA: hypothetical protein [Caudoviricetes sp.]